MTAATRRADVLLCAGCRHPVRKHGPNGCRLGECWCEIEGAPETPRRTDPRPATDGALDVAAVGGDDAVEEVAAAVSVATGAAVTSDEQAAAATLHAAAALDEVADLVQQVLTHAFMFSIRWYCPSCIDWPLDPGACRVCKAPLQPVYLATLPREIPA